MMKMTKKIKKRSALKAAFAVYCIAVILIMAVPNRIPATVLTYRDYISSHVNLVPLSSIAFYIKAAIGNTVNSSTIYGFFASPILFFPLGIFVAALSDERKHARNAIAIAEMILGIAAIEALQLFTLVGSFDVDSILMRTIWAAVGLLLFRLVQSIRKNYYKNVNSAEKA